jgi:thiamine monophosphate synthase
MTLHLLAISPGRGFEPERWKPLLHSGVDALLLREPGLEARPLLDALRWCQDRAPHLAYWVRGRLDVALAAGCGVHLPEGHPDLPPNLLPHSRPLHAPADLPMRLGATQLLISPVFDVPGKGHPWGVQALRALLDTLPPEAPRMLALGGIRPEHLPALRHPRLAGVAAIRALWDAPDPRRAVADFRAGWGGA